MLPAWRAVTLDVGEKTRFFVIARSEATKQSTLASWRNGLLRFARNDGGKDCING